MVDKAQSELAAAQEEERRAIANLAMSALRQAVQHGFHDVESLRTNPDLAPLRSRDDFQALVATLASKVR